MRSSDSIQKVSDQMRDLKREYAKGLFENQNERSDNVAGQYNRIQDLQDQLTGASNSPGALSTDQIVNVLGNRTKTGGAFATKLSAEDVRAFNLTSGQETQVNLSLQLQQERQALMDYLSKNVAGAGPLLAGKNPGSADTDSV